MAFSTFGAIGASVGAGAAASAGAIVAGMAITAVVGAAIGGIASAVTGGDIGKGMLFGAVGGLVTGFASGILGGMFGTAGGAAGSAASGGEFASGAVYSAEGTVVSGSTANMGASGLGSGVNVVSSGTPGAGGSTASGIMGKLGEVALEGTINTGGQMLMGMSAEASAKDLAEAKAISDQLDRESRERIANSHAPAAAHPDWAQEEVGRNRRHAEEIKLGYYKIDAPREDAEASRKRMAGTIMAMNTRRKGVLQGLPPSAQEQIFNKSSAINPETPVSAEGVA